MGGVQTSPAEKALERFWGHGPGSVEQLAQVEQLIRESGTDPKSLVPKVPGIGGGTPTGDRCQRAAAMLRRLVEEDRDATSESEGPTQAPSRRKRKE